MTLINNSTRASIPRPIVPNKRKNILFSEMKDKLITAVKIVDKLCLTTTISLVHVKLGNIRLSRMPKIEMQNKFIIKKNVVIVKLKPLNKNVFQHTRIVMIRPGTYNVIFTSTFAKLSSKTEIGRL